MQSMWININLILFLGLESYIDYKTKHVNTLLCLIFSLIGLMYQAKNAGNIKNIYVGLFFIVLIYIFCLLTNGQIGIGDGYVIGTMAIFLGLEVVWIFVKALFICSILSIGLIFCKKINKKATIPFVPFLLMAYTINIF